MKIIDRIQIENPLTSKTFNLLHQNLNEYYLIIFETNTKTKSTLVLKACGFSHKRNVNNIFPYL